MMNSFGTSRMLEMNAKRGNQQLSIFSTAAIVSRSTPHYIAVRGDHPRSLHNQPELLLLVATISAEQFAPPSPKCELE
jgi:hypothetical protein